MRRANVRKLVHADGHVVSLRVIPGGARPRREWPLERTEVPVVVATVGLVTLLFTCLYRVLVASAEMP
jgi:hypothetical protein